MHGIANDSIANSWIFYWIFLFLFLFDAINEWFFIRFQTNQNNDFAVLLITTIQTFYAFGIMFVACELCQRSNCEFGECNGMINQFKWYLFPVNVKRILPIIINHAQQSVDIKCFGSTASNRETFKYVSVSEQIICVFQG